MAAGKGERNLAFCSFLLRRGREWHGIRSLDAEKVQSILRIGRDERDKERVRARKREEEGSAVRIACHAMRLVLLLYCYVS